MLESFDSPREVLDRARDHVEDFKSKCAAFFEAKPYTTVIDYDRNARQEVHKIRLTAKLPGKLTAVAKDAISNLRDCLDHCIYSSCVAIGRSDAKTTKFPFSDTARDFEGELWSLREVSPAIWEIIERFRPYKGGNDLLWALNKIRNTKTHRVLVPVGAASIASNLFMNGSKIIGPAHIGYHRWDPAKNEVEFLRIGLGSEVSYQVNIAFTVAFGNVEVIGGQPVSGVLDALVREVECILLAIEAETKRITSN